MTQANPNRIKAETRKQAAASRAAASKANPEAAEKLAKFAEHLIAEFNPQNIAGYWPIKSELDGGGFYDRTLASLAHKGNTITAIGIAYESQKMDKVPTGYFDRRLDGVLTPSGLIMG